MIKAEATLALQRALVRLSNWRSRTVNARNLCGELGAHAKLAAEPFLQELEDRYCCAENKVLRLQMEALHLQSPSAWQRVRSEVDESFSQLEKASRPVGRILESG